LIKSIIQSIIYFIQHIILFIFDFVFKFKQKKHYDCIIGVEEIANFNHDLKNVFGKNVCNINFAKNQFYPNNIYDYTITSSNKYFAFILKAFYGPYLLAKLSHQSDIFIYLWWTGFCMDRALDYKFLKKKKKKIVCIFLGSDIRSPKLTIEYYTKLKQDTWLNYVSNLIDIEKEDERVKRVALLADTYADLIYNYPADQISYLRSKQTHFPYMMSKNKLYYDETKFENLDKPTIVHAPSKSIVKGTPLVRSAIKKLESEGYKFHYIEFQNTPNEIVMEALKHSHIVINEFYALVPGVFSIEGMANCNAVITSADYEEFPEDAKYAWYKTEYWRIYDNLKLLLENPSEIKKYALNGYAFVQNHYTEGSVKQFYIDSFYNHHIINEKRWTK
jgi:hypothetical protein